MLKVQNNFNKTTATSVRLDEETKKGISKLAKLDNRSTSYLINEAVKNYLDLRQWQLKEIIEAIKEYENGNTVSHKEIQEILRSE